MLTVQEAMQMEVFQDCRLLTGAAGLDRRIQSINILEILDELSHLEQGEFLITTAFDLSMQPEEQQVKMMEVFAERKIAALAIQTGIYLLEVPEALLQKARELELPIIELPAHLSFKDMIRSLLGRLLERESSNLDFRQRVNRQLMEGYMAKGLPWMINHLSQIIQRPVFLYNAFFQSMDEESSPEKDAMANSLFAYLQKKNPAGGHFKEHETMEISGCKGLPDLALVPIRIHEETYGYLAAQGQNFSSMELISLKQAASICLLELVKQKDIFKSRTREIKELMQRLLDGENPEDFLHILEPMNLSLDSSYEVLVVTIPNGDKAPAGPYTGIKRYEMERAAPKIIKLLQGVPALTSLDDRGFLISFLPVAGGTRPSRANNCAWLQENLEQVHPHTPFLMGVGNPCRGLGSIRQSYDEALLAIKAASLGLLEKEKGLCAYNQLGYLKLFMEIENNHALLSFFRETIAPLLDYDQNYHGELVPTLKAYVKHLNINRAAAELYVHRHTLKYRLNKIAEITGFDLKESENIFQLFMGLKLCEYLQKKDAL